MKVTCGIFLYSLVSRKILVCHATNSRWNQWSIPKGIPDEGESWLAAAVRELREETAIDIAQLVITRLVSLPASKYQKQEKELVSFLVITPDTLDNYEFKSSLVEGKGFPEIDSWKWITLEEAQTTIHESQARNLALIATLTES